MEDLEEWSNLTNKDSIMETVQRFKEHLRSFELVQLNKNTYIGTMSSPGPGINTPILQTSNDWNYDMDNFIFDFEWAINPSISLEMDTKRAKEIIDNCSDPLASTPLIQKLVLEKGDSVDNFIHSFECMMQLHDHKPTCPESLINTELGKNILEDLKSANYSPSRFCHNALHYKNFVLKDNQLIGITGWEYSGRYPPELEDIIAKYIDQL
jgi:hypothetical protein